LLGAAPARGDGSGGESIATDRPDFVESSQAVGARRFQIETSVAYERVKAGALTTHTITSPTLLRFGVADGWEVRLETDAFVWSRGDVADDAARATESGFSDLSFGAKWHTHDGGSGAWSPSIGWLLHADVSTGSEPFRGDGVRPSLRAVGEWQLPGCLSLGLMPGIAYESADAGGRRAAGIFGAVVGRQLTPSLRAFAELSAQQIAGEALGGDIVTVDLGAALLVSPVTQVDTAVSFGLTDGSPDFAWTLGLSSLR
jgi:hypothetical protein